MIPHSEFGQLRLSQFMPAQEITPLDNWEFLGRECVGEAVGFSEWLRPAADANELRSLSLDLTDLPAPVIEAVLKQLDLPLRAAMSLHEIEAVLGAPVSVRRFRPDRLSYEFEYGSEEARYVIDCTIEDTHGLVYLVICVAGDNTHK